MCLQHADLTSHCGLASKPRGLHASLPVGVEQLGDFTNLRVDLLRSIRRIARVSTGFDLTDEAAFPIASFFHRLNGTLLAWLHSRNRELVCGDAIPIALVHHIEPQMFETLPPVLARAFRASSSDHGSSFMRSLLLFWLRDFCWYAAFDPVHDIGWMKAAASHTESLRREQPAQI